MTERETTTTTPELSVASPASILTENIIASDATTDASENIATIERFFCRICRQDASKEALAILCNCGTPDGLTHVSCLEKRLSNDDLAVYSCDVCNYIFEVERVNTPILQWTKNAAERCNLICLIVVILGLTYGMLAIMFRRFTNFGTSFPLDHYTINSDTRVTFITIIGYCCGCYALCRNIANSWRNLRESNRKVKLVVPPRQLHEEVRDNNGELVEESVV